MLDRISVQRHSNGCGCDMESDFARRERMETCGSCGCGCGIDMGSNMQSRERTENTDNHGNCGCENSNMRTTERNSCHMCERMQVEQSECGCERNDADADSCDFNYSLAMVYSPNQEWQNLYCEEEGMMAGTIFKELDKPFYGAKCHGGNGNV